MKKDDVIEFDLHGAPVRTVTEAVERFRDEQLDLRIADMRRRRRPVVTVSWPPLSGSVGGVLAKSKATGALSVQLLHDVAAFKAGEVVSLMPYEVQELSP